MAKKKKINCEAGKIRFEADLQAAAVSDRIGFMLANGSIEARVT